MEPADFEAGFLAGLLVRVVGLIVGETSDNGFQNFRPTDTSMTECRCCGAVFKSARGHKRHLEGWPKPCLQSQPVSPTSCANDEYDWLIQGLQESLPSPSQESLTSEFQTQRDEVSLLKNIIFIPLISLRMTSWIQLCRKRPTQMAQATTTIWTM